MMTEDQIWDLAARIERVALGWAQDALRYRGKRRQVRQDRADYLFGRVEFILIESFC